MSTRVLCIIELVNKNYIDLDNNVYNKTKIVLSDYTICKYAW